MVVVTGDDVCASVSYHPSSLISHEIQQSIDCYFKNTQNVLESREREESV